ncbi:hypothetical protein Q426_06455 [Streptococcus equi subsp. zooepidemicus CY]|nr:hypothetical protein Q426_06455 [Streptococcus equi subsp. zooepidemicus CY]
MYENNAKLHPKISIHTPAKGVINELSISSLTTDISFHVPVKGADQPFST